MYTTPTYERIRRAHAPSVPAPRYDSGSLNCKLREARKLVNGVRKRMILSARARATEGGYPCTITLNDIVIPTRCPVLGIPLRSSVGRLEGVTDNSPSLDKVVPALGYVPGNVIVVSHRANRLKSDASLAELTLLARFYKSWAAR
jgi:hypothetical protein